MPGLFDGIAPLLPIAQDAGAEGGGGGGLPSLLIMFAPVIVLYYLMILRPQSQQRKQHQELLDRLKKNDRVVTHAGIFGTVVSVDEKADRIVLRIDDEKGVKLTCRKSSILGMADPSGAEAEKKAS